ncbi:hypothetical protein [Mammaliicoccus sciuri]|uniref:hypothetical protein n=1 Tax=Mammaliicoccus sciuri TaxID=1296 RepID=UPI00194ED373|nr:hypothetical protein [Mammaliicoccus sciuri]
MAYEYEEIIVKQHLSNFKSKTGKIIDTKESLELREVYAKAKAFDVIKKLEKETILYSVAGKEDVELGAEARKIINKYMEDK